MTTIHTERAENGPVRRTTEVVAVSMPKNRMSGFHQGLLTGEGEDYAFEVTTTAGLGGASLYLTVKKDGKEVAYESMHLIPMIEQWASAVISDHKTGLATPWQGQPKAEDFPEGWV